MPKQNIFDNETFFEGYKKIREKESNANDLFEIPTLFSLLPDLTGKRVLDLGCGYGEHCISFVQKEQTGVWALIFFNDSKYAGRGRFYHRENGRAAA